MYNKARVGAAILDRWSGPWDFFSSKFRKSVPPPPPASVERRVPVSRITPNKISFHNWVVALCSVTQPYLTLVTPWTVAHQAPLSMEFSRQEYWSGLPFPPPGDLPYPGIKPMSLTSPALADRFFTTSATWEAPTLKYQTEAIQFLRFQVSVFKYLYVFKIKHKGTSLVAQWLRVHLPMQGTWIWSLVQEDSTCHGPTKSMGHNYWACTLEPLSHDCWSLYALEASAVRNSYTATRE